MNYEYSRTPPERVGKTFMPLVEADCAHTIDYLLKAEAVIEAAALCREPAGLMSPEDPR